MLISHQTQVVSLDTADRKLTIINRHQTSISISSHPSPTFQPR